MLDLFNNDEILFDEQIHQYTDPETGDVVRSTTQIMSDLGLGKYAGKEKTEEDEKRLRWYADRGTLAHYGLENYLNGITDLAVLKDMVADKAKELGRDFREAIPFITSGIKWITGMKNFSFTEAEKKFQVKRENGAYAGTIDVVCQFDGAVAVLDWKTSKDIDQETYKLQIAAYAERMSCNTGMIIKLLENGECAEELIVDVKTYREKWNALLDIYFGDKPEDEKKELAKQVVTGSEKIPEDIAKDIIELNKEKKNYDLMSKTVANRIDEIKTKLTDGRKNNMFYSDNDNEITLDFRSKSTVKVDTNTILKELVAMFSDEDAKRIEAVFEKNTSVSDSGTYYLTVKEKKKTKAETGSETKEAPAKKTRTKKSEKPVQEPEVKEEIPAAVIEPDSLKVKEVSAADTPRTLPERIESMLNAKGCTPELIESFWRHLEGVHKVSRSAPEFDMEKALDIAEETNLRIITEIHNDMKKGKF